MATHAHTHSRAGCSSDVSGARSSPYPMIDVPTALSHVLSAVHPLPAVQRSVLSPDVLGAVLSADVVSAMAFPPFAASVMDGYAVVCPCPAGVYPVTQRCTAGSRSTTPLLPGQAAYITTGSALPPGADGVIMVEMTEAMEGATEQVRLLEDVPIGQHVRAVGSDIAEGQRLCAAGAAVSAAEVGLLVSQCIAAVSVHRRPVIGVLSSGDELVDPSTGTAPPPGCIADSNRVMLRALLTQHTSAEVVDLGIARDSLSALDGLLMPSVVGSLDALVTTGGVSMGELDLIKAFLARSARVLLRSPQHEAGQADDVRPAAQGRRAASARLRAAGQPRVGLRVLSVARAAGCQADGGPGGGRQRPRVRALRGEERGDAEEERGQA